MSEPSITCPVCGRTSHNPNDVSHGYCGHCHEWTGAIRRLVNAMPFDDVAEGMYFDKQGHPISLARFSWLIERDVELMQQGMGGKHPELYKRVASNEMEDGIWVSTVWLGTNMAFYGGPPEIFETAVFMNGECNIINRYSTEAEARQSHEALVRALEFVGARKYLWELLHEDDGP